VLTELATMKIKLLLLVIVGATGLASPGRAAHALDTWTARNPLPTGNSLYAVTYGLVINGATNFIAVGESGTILTASTGSNWVTRVSGTNCDLYGVALGTNSSGNVQVVAVGSLAATGEGRMVTSPDGFNWSPANPGTTNGLNAVAYGANGSGTALFVAVGNGGTIIASSDGTNWTTRASGTTNALFSVAYGNLSGQNTFVAVGLHINSDATLSGTFITSTDGGNTWTPSPLFPPPGAFKSVGYTSGGFVVAGNGGSINTASDGVTWKQRTSGTALNLNGLTFGNGLVVVVGQSGVVLTSPDGKTWTTNSSGVTANLYGVAYGNNTYVAVGDSGLSLTSPNASSWGINRFRVVVARFTAVAYGNDNYVAVTGVQGSSGNVVTSSNGVYWVHLAAVTNSALFGVAFGTNSFGNPLFIATGNAIAGNAANILISPDAANWTTLSPGGTNSLLAVTCGTNQSGPLFVAVGGLGMVLTSADGTNWTSHSTGRPNSLNAAAYGDGRFVAVGQAGATVASTDGVNWSNNNAAALNATLDGVTYGNGLFVATGPSSGGLGPVYVSTDGVNWTRNASLNPLTSLNAVAYGHGTFVAVGPLETTYAETAAVFTSTDGTNWVWRNCGAWGNLNAITYGSGPASQFIAVGDFDQILGATFSVAVPVSYSPLTGARLPLMNFPYGRIINLQTSHDLATWSLLTNIFLTRGTPSATITDSSAANYTNGFYRIGIR
jgi:hypothetical protein